MRSDPIPFLTTHHLSYTQADDTVVDDVAGGHQNNKEAPAAPTPRRDGVSVRPRSACYIPVPFYLPDLSHS